MNFNKKIFVLFLFGMGLTFSSCSFWERRGKQLMTSLSKDKCWTGNSPFVVSQITKSPNSNEAITFSYKEGLKEYFTLHLKACIRELLRPDSPFQQGAPFIVEYYKSLEDKKAGKKTREPTLTNEDGCIQWQETYKYKYTVKPVWIGLERTIKKESAPFAGAEIIPMAVNPWLSEKDKNEGVHSILDTRCEYSRRHAQKRHYKAEGLNYLQTINTEEKPLLWAPTVDMQIREVNPNDSRKPAPTPSEKEIRALLKKFQTPCIKVDQNSCYRRRLNMTLFIPLFARSLDSSSSVTDEKLNGGIYDIEAQIIISPDTSNETYRLHEQICRHKNTKLNQTDRAFSLSCELNMSHFNANTVYQLTLRIKPSSKDLPFKKFEGIYSFKPSFEHKREKLPIDSVYDSNYTASLETGKKLSIIEDMKIGSIYKSDNSIEDVESNEVRADSYYDKEGPIEGINLYPLHLDGHGDYKLSHIQSGLKCEERENVVERTAIFVGKVCLTEVLESQKINNAPFRIFLEKPIGKQYRRDLL